ncbi:MAG: TonB-dependent receptor plug domain-containing protein [Myxococcota bacterium]|nr:TonB-dependent receptor plug domain-containing protein [Myxococcota bacterium]
MLSLLPLLLAQEPLTVAPSLLQPVTPAYPSDAGEASGTVLVQVDVDAQGQVVGVRVVSGPEVFRPAAEAAAWQLHFSPGSQEGEPVAVADLPVTFHFAPPHDPHEHDAMLVVEAERFEHLHPQPVAELDEQDLAQTRGQDLGATLEQLPGVTRAAGTGDTSKPMIRGQTERRLLLLVDGVPHASQKWGQDHAPEIDPFAAGTVEVLMGAAGVRYGPEAIGGVVMLKPPELLGGPGVYGHADLALTDNGRQGYAAARLDGGIGSNWAWRVEGNLRSSGDLSAPDYLLGNTASRVWNAGGQLAWTGASTTLRLSLSHYDQISGVFYGVQVSDLGALGEGTVPTGAKGWSFDRQWERPYQRVQHERVLLHWDQELPVGELRTVGAMQLNHRQEFDTVRQDTGSAQFDFLLQTWSLESAWVQPSLSLGDWELEGEQGVSGNLALNAYSGLPLVPNYASRNLGAYSLQRLGNARMHIEAGLRGDWMARRSYLTDQAYARHENAGTLEDGVCTLSDDIATCDHRWAGLSASAGVNWHAVLDTLELRVDLSRATRFPSADEQFMNGVAPTMPVYALGDPSLPLEKAWTLNPSLGSDLGWLRLEISPYLQHIQDYVYFAPVVSDGEVTVDVTVRGAFPRYSYRSVDARFVGIDGSLAILPTPTLELELAGAAVRAHDTALDQTLVGLPGDSAHLAVAWMPPLGGLRDFRVQVVGRAVAQAKVDPGLDLAATPQGYQVLDANLGLTLPSYRKDWRLSLSGQNLLNTPTRDATGLLRYYADNPGRRITLRASVDF